MKMKVTTANHKHEAKDLYLAEVGLTAAQIESASAALPGTKLNLSCSDAGCHIAANEFELLSSGWPHPDNAA